MKKLLSLTTIGLFAFAGNVWANCPAVTVADSKGVGAGKYPQQYELAEFESLAGCKMSFTANPDIDSLNAKIRGNGKLPPLSERIPQEPLVYAPYHSID